MPAEVSKLILRVFWKVVYIWKKRQKILVCDIFCSILEIILKEKNHLIFMMQQPIVRILDKTMCFLLSFHICITIEKLHYIVRMCMCPPEHPMCNGSIVKQIALGSMVALFRPRSKCVRYHLGPFYTFY